MPTSRFIEDDEDMVEFENDHDTDAKPAHKRFSHLAGQDAVLVAIARGARSQSMIRSDTGIASSTTHFHVQNLIEAGLIAEDRSKGVPRYDLTKSGKIKAKAISVH